MSQARIHLVMVLAIAAIAAASEEDALSSAVVPTPPVPTPPAPTPEPCSCCDLCNIVPGPFLAVPGGGSSSSAPILPPPPSPPVPVPAPPAAVNCVTASSGLAPCGTFLTGRAVPPPTPQSSCCNGLAAFLSSARAAGPVAGEQRLRCLCPIIHGDVNAVVPKPVDPVSMMYLPVACGLALPPDTIAICFGQHMPTIANLTSGMQQELTHP